MMKFLKTKQHKRVRDANVDDNVFPKLVKTKTNSKYLIGCLDKDIRPLVLIMTKTREDVKALKVQVKIRKLMCSFFFRKMQR